ncbi:hypothetical protein GCM10017608_09290 [Agromyces luteolus]|uniref:Uncharacterized protein n=1 Tax=Agromyces luteolus TaxID=88373 RepID=A0A7C9HJC3_9MICO|nr:hypothetical protein [Agromyces luteolus]MUN08463.1 hypothetical protein [Agromyces luteolus]GLK26996.1 hypothetical protein GCM10017608_09290 [Agromyces luteolus]
MTYPLYPADAANDVADPFRNLDPPPTTGSTAVIDAGPDGFDGLVERPPTREEIAERQAEEFGGPKVGAGFFGVLVAVATGSGLVGALVLADALLGVGVIPDPWGTGGIGPLDPTTVGWVVVGVLLAIVLAASYCGGYVAGRMARFSGVAQGLAVWVWAIAIAIAAAIGVVLLDDRYDLLARAMAALPSLPVPPDALVVVGVVAAASVAAITLGGAVLGGVVGVRFHRRVDRVGSDDSAGRPASAGW